MSFVRKWVHHMKWTRSDAERQNFTFSFNFDSQNSLLAHTTWELKVHDGKEEGTKEREEEEVNMVRVCNILERNYLHETKHHVQWISTKKNIGKCHPYFQMDEHGFEWSQHCEWHLHEVYNQCKRARDTAPWESACLACAKLQVQVLILQKTTKTTLTVVYRSTLTLYGKNYALG